MAVGPTPRLILFALLLAAGAAAPQDVTTLARAAARSGRDFTAVYEGRAVTVRAQVASAPVWALGTYYLPLRDATDHGLILRGDREPFVAFRPGDSVEVKGVIHSRGGLPLLSPDSIRKLSSGAAPAPKELTLAELSGLRYVGLTVRSRGTVASIGENLGGKVLQVGDRGYTMAVFLPHDASADGKELSRVRAGDVVRLTGLATQYSPEPPYDGSFQIMLRSPEDLEVLEGVATFSPLLILSALGAVAVLLGLWWMRRKHARAQHESMRAFHSLSEAIIAARSPAEMAEKLVSVLPTVTRATGVRLYVFNRRVKALECVPTAADPDPMAAPVESPPDGLAGAAVLCFHNRRVLHVPDVRRNPSVKVNTKTNLPRAAMFVPLFGQNEVIGVLEFDNAHRLGYFTPEEQAVAQHLANQAAAALKLQEQQALREQVLHSEKLAATGQLISGVASELRAPLEKIRQLATSLTQYRGRPVPERDLRELAGQSLHASEIVSRLVSFARPEDSMAGPVDVNAVVANLMQFREPEWKTLGLRVQNRLAPAAALVLGAQGQIEQVFLNLLVHAEQHASETAAKTITVTSSLIARQVVVEISYSAPPVPPGDAAASDAVPNPLAEAGPQGLGVCLGIIQSHGGEIRFRNRAGTARFDVDLPLTHGAEEHPRASEMRSASSPLTVMLVDTDPGGQRQLLGLLSMRGHRVVPVPFAEAADLVQRLRFDAVLWAIRPTGSRWSEFHERIRTHAGAFVLLSEGYDPELARSLEESGGFLLGRPVKESELDAILSRIEARVPNGSAVRPAR